MSSAFLETYEHTRFGPSPVQTIGFAGGRSCEQIIVVVRELCFYSHEWGSPVLIASLDILAAFDHIDHGILLQALIKRGWEVERALAAIRELHKVMSTAQVAGARQSDGVPYLKGGIQGGPGTPKDFNCLLEVLLEPVIWGWMEQNKGFQPLGYCGNPFGPAISH